MPEKIYSNILNVSNRKEFRKWLEENCTVEKECYVVLKRGKPKDDGNLYYLDVVEEALCFGWIDSTIRVINGISYQRFSPRSKKSSWTELNKERVRRLERLGLMTDEGRKVLPEDFDKKFVVDEETQKALKKARVWSKFCLFPPLYQRIRASNLEFYRKRHKEGYERMLNHTIEATKKGEMFGEWNDYGRLI